MESQEIANALWDIDVSYWDMTTFTPSEEIQDDPFSLWWSIRHTSYIGYEDPKI
jgi:hypothetical protein